MKQTKFAPMFMHELAPIAVSALCAVQFTCANTNELNCMVYQP